MQPPIDAMPALERACRHLLDLQRADGSWEGEMVWCPMLTAQYVLLHHVIGHPLEPARRRNILRSFECTRLEQGAWGMHEHSSPHLFVTALVYIAARVLDVDKDDPLLAPSRDFLRAEGVLNIPTWGKFWLAVLHLYDWRGINAILPELWGAPKWIAIHPSNWYCHTRLIYMSMAVIYARRFRAGLTPVISSLRDELYPDGYETADFAASRNRLRSADLFARPSTWLRIGFALAGLYERLHSRRRRDRCLRAIIHQIRWELRTSNHSSISPVSGLLNILVLWLEDPDDPDCRAALARLEDWIWEDPQGGTRVTGARSSSWDTAFALQALACLPGDAEAPGAKDAVQRGTRYLRGQQITRSFAGFGEAHRVDPRGGWCFPGAQHGWPVTDCTAESVLGTLSAHGEETPTESLREAIRFMLQGQNCDGGFGSYEARKSAVTLEWMNPAEMFGESMTEHSFVECTASCLAAFAACLRHSPELGTRELTKAVSRADRWLRRTQGSDGSWRGVWGIQFIYGTWFGCRGLLAAGASREDPRLRRACRWLLERQRDDGGWGEHHSGCMTGRYVPHQESQIIQTAWALIALLEAGEPDWMAISRGARFLADTQDADGGWPKQDNAGVFFRTALLDYVLYRQYFPVHALALYEQRRKHGGVA